MKTRVIKGLHTIPVPEVTNTPPDEPELRSCDFCSHRRGPALSGWVFCNQLPIGQMALDRRCANYTTHQGAPSGVVAVRSRNVAMAPGYLMVRAELPITISDHGDVRPTPPPMQSRFDFDIKDPLLFILVSVASLVGICVGMYFSVYFIRGWLGLPL